MEIREVYWKITAYNDKHIDDLFWMRWQTTQLINIQLEKKDRIEPEILFSLPTDKKVSKKSKLTDEQIKNRLEKWDKHELRSTTVVVKEEELKKLFSLEDKK